MTSFGIYRSHSNIWKETISALVKNESSQTIAETHSPKAILKYGAKLSLGATGAWQMAKALKMDRFP